MKVRQRGVGGDRFSLPFFSGRPSGWLSEATSPHLRSRRIEEESAFAGDVLKFALRAPRACRAIRAEAARAGARAHYLPCPVRALRPERTRDALQAQTAFTCFTTPHFDAELRVSLEQVEYSTVNARHVQSLP